MATDIVNVHAAKTHLSRLLEQVEAGQEVVIALDPFDRMRIAQAIVEQLTLVTRDATIQRYDVPTIAA